MAQFLKTLVAVAVTGTALMGAKSAHAGSGTFAFNQTNTAGDTQNYLTSTFTANAGDVIKVSTSASGTCALPGVTGSGDTFLRLLNPSGTEVVNNDDACSGAQSFLTFTAASSGTYSIRTGCYSTGSCSGTGAWSTTGPAAVHGVVFIHGTGNYPGTLTCSGSGSSTACTVPAAVSGYWGQGEVDSIRNGRAYAVVGFNGGSCAPWPSGTTTGLTAGSVTDTHYSGSCSTGGNGDVIAAQIQQFITAGGITDLVIVTHSGGSNQARFILQNYTRNTAYTAVKNATRRVITVAAPTLGTHLADVAITSTLLSPIASLVGYGGEGVNFIRTDYMAAYNATNSYFAGLNNPVQGVNFYSTGGVSGSKCFGVKVFGACVGITGPTLGGSSCDSGLLDTGLLALHDLFLNGNNSTQATNGCSDGFISCMSSQRLGNNFSFNQSQDHNQSRRQCNGLDVAIRNMVSGATAGFSIEGYSAAQASPAQVDACGFTKSTYIQNACTTNSDCTWVHGTCVSGWCVSNVGGTCTTDAYCQANYGASTTCLSGHCGYADGFHNGCSKAELGDGYCDPDCVAIYGNDATPTWDATGTKVVAWGATSDCSNPSTGADQGNYAWSSPSYNGKTGLNAGYTTQWFLDPGISGQAISSCPSSLIGDGVCDECVLALYGADGSDCLPSKVTQCSLLESYQASYEFTANALSNNGYLKKISGVWSYYPSVVVSMSGFGNDGTCELGECTASTTFPGTGQCNTTADCASGVCVSGGCQANNTIGNDCVISYPVPARTCATNADCSGNACANPTGGASAGKCLLSLGSCTTDGDCPTTGTTSTCNAGVCGCSTSADCSGGAACTGGVCAATVTTSLCR